MASRVKGITVEIGGDATGLNKALSSVNTKISNTSSQLKDVERLLKLDPTNTELLAQKQRLLGGNIATTKEKLETLRNAERQVQEQFKKGKASQEQVDALKREIIATEQSLNKLENGADDANSALKKAGKTGADSANDIEHKMSGAGKAVAGVAAGIATAFAAVGAGAIAAGKALVKFTTGGATYADEVLTTATQTGIATDKLQEYMYAAELVDVSTETLTKSMAKQIKSMKAAQDGTALTVDAYDKLGVQVTNADGSLRDSDAVYWETIDALGKIENETERDALAMQLLGKSAQELNPLIEAGAERMNELGAQAQAAGYVMGDDMLQAYGALDDNIQTLKVNAEGAKNALGTVLLPVLTELSGTGTELLSEFTNGIKNANGDIGAMSDVIGDILPKAIDAIMEYVPELIEVIGAIVGALGQAIVDNLPQIIEAATGIVFSIMDGLVAALPQIADGALQLVLSLVNGIVAALPKIIEAGVQMIAALLQGLADALPTMIPAIVQGVVLAAQTLIDNLPILLDAVLQIVMGLVDGLLEALPMLISALPAMIKGIVKFLLDSIPVLIDAAVNIVMGIVDALPEIIDALIDAIPQIISDVITAVINALPKIIMALVKAVPKIVLGIVGAFAQMVFKFVEVGADLLEGLWDGIKSAATWLWNKISGWASDLWDGIKSFFSGGDKKAEKVGADVAKGIAKGIEKEEKTPIEAVKDVGTKMAKAANDLARKTANAVAAGYKKAYNDARFEAMRVAEATEDIIASAAEAAEAFSDMLSETTKSVSETESYYTHITDLAAELDALADANGAVEEADRSRVQFILNELNEALGTEYTMVDGIIQKYSELKNGVNEVIQQKRVNALLSAHEDDYEQALLNEQGAVDAVAASQEAYNAKLSEYNALAEEIKRQEAIDPQAVDPNLYIRAETLQRELAEAENAYLQAIDALVQIEETIAKYEGAVTKILEGDYAGAEAVLKKTSALMTDEQRKRLEAQKGYTAEYKADWEEAVDSGESYAASFGRTYTSSLEYLNGVYTKALGLGDDLSAGLVAGIENGTDPVVGAVIRLVNEAITAGRTEADSHSPSRKMIALGEDMGEGAEIGIEKKVEGAEESGKHLAASITDGFIVSIAGVIDGLRNMHIPTMAPAFASVPSSPSYGSGILSIAGQQQGASQTYNNSSRFGDINLYVNAPNVDNVNDLAALVADQINDSLIAKQAVNGR